MNFNRKTFYGLNFNWYMIDAIGEIAMFMCGYGPIPEDIFVDENNYLRIDSFFNHLLPLSEFYYSAESQIINITEENVLFNEVKAVGKGIYVYDNEEFTDNYELVAIPKIPLKFSDLPSDIKELISQFVIMDVKFSEIKRLNVKDYFDCK